MKFFRRIMHVVLVCAVLSAGLSGAEAWASLTAKQADVLMLKAQSGDKAAVDILINEARQGDGNALTDLGVLLVWNEDYDKAVPLFRMAVEQGNAGGQFNLGLLYLNGQGLPQDDGQAAQWFRKAAAQGFTAA
jgi:TPR repeat protein